MTTTNMIKSSDYAQVKLMYDTQSNMYQSQATVCDVIISVTFPQPLQQREEEDEEEGHHQDPRIP